MTTAKHRILTSDPSRKSLEDQRKSKAARHALNYSAENEELKSLGESGLAETHFQQNALHALFESQVEKSPDSVAINVDGEPLSYAELNAFSNRLAHALVKAGVRPGDRVATLLDPNSEQIAAILAVLKATGVFVGLDADHPTGRLETILREAEPFALIARLSNLEAHRKLQTWIRENGLRVIIVDADASEIDGQFEAIGCDDVAELQSSNLSLPIEVSAEAYIAYTSGSTGTPKGIVGTHQSFAQFLQWQAKEIGIKAGQRFAQWASIGYDASYCEILGSLCFGATLCITRAHDRFSPRDLVEWVTKERIEILQVVPSFAREALQFVPGNCVSPDRPLPDLRVLMLAGERLPVDLATSWHNRVPGLTIYNLYGPSECVLATYHKVEPPSAEQRSVSIGRAIDGREILVLDDELRPCPFGVEGEIFIRSPFLTAGYFKQPEETAKRYIQNPLHNDFDDPVFRTGDKARWNEDGSLDFVGRSDSLVKLRGMRIELGDIEVALRAHDDVNEAVVLVREAVRMDRLTAKAVEARDAKSSSSQAKQVLIAYITMSGHATVPELRQHLSEQLPKHMIPNQFVVLDALPKNANNKLDVKSLPPPTAARPELENKFVAPRNDLETTIAGIWQDCLNIPDIGVHDNFFDLGGDSLLAMQVLNRVSENTGRQITYRDLTERGTVAAMAELLQSSTADLQPSRSIEKSEPRRHYPLSVAQQGLWYLWNVEPESPFYNALGCIHLSGPLDVSALREAWQAMLDRHVVVRTRFTRVDGEAAIVFDENRRIVPLPLEDLTQLPVDERDAELARRAKESASKSFHLEKDPLLRATLYRKADDQHELLFTYHEIILDLWGFAVMIQDLIALYRDLVSDQPASLTPVEIDFRDYLVWEHENIRRDRLVSQQSFWKEQLEGELPVLELPLDRPRPKEPYYAGAAKSVMLDAELSEKLRQLSRKCETTLFTTLLTAFNVLLRSYSDQDDVIIGTPYANRSSESIERMVGWFLNMLPIRTRFGSRMSFADALSEVHSSVTGAISNSDYPFSWMLVDCDIQRDRSVSPVFQVMFNWQNLPQAEIANDELIVSSSELDSGYKKYDLALYAQEHVDRIYLHMSYLSAIFDDETVERMLSTMVRLLELVVANPYESLDDLEVATVEEQSRIANFSSADRDFGPMLSINESFEALAAEMSDSPAFLFEKRSISYGESNQQANYWAELMRACGAGPGKIVAIHAERSIELVLAVLATVKTGAAYVVLDPSHPQMQLEDILRDTDPVVLVSQKGLEPLSAYQGQVLDLDSDAGKAAAYALTPANRNLSDLLTVVYTSASTGRAKGVRIPERAILNRLHWMWDAHPFQNGDVAVLHKSLSIVASTWELFGPLLKGIPTVIMSRHEVLNPPRFFETVVKQKATHLLASPPVIEGLLDEQDAATENRWTSLRFATTSAEAIAPALVHRWRQTFPNVPLLNLYGSTECSSNATVYDTGALPSDAIRVPIGRPIANVKVDVLSRGLKPVPIGAVGEMCVSGACLSDGYMNLPELTAEKWVEKDSARTLRTGDLVRYRADGNLELLGRRDRQVNVRGFRVDLDDVESSLAGLETVRRSAVLLRYGGTTKARLAAFVETSETSTPDDIRSHLRDRLPDYMVPSSVIITDALPLTPSGKIDRRALEAIEVREERSTENLAPPRDDLELRLCKLWEEVLDIGGIGIQHHFFDVGGHSLLAVHMISRVEKEFEKSVSLAGFLQEPTIERLAQLLRDEGLAANMSALVPLRAAGNRLPFFTICGVHLYRELAANLSDDQPVYAIFIEEDNDALVSEVEDLDTDTLGTLEDRAASYINEIRTIQPHGPYHLGGVSYGGLLAFEIAQQLVAAGEEVALVAIFDSMLKRYVARSLFRRAMSSAANAIRKLRELLTRQDQKKAEVITEIGRMSRLRQHIYNVTAHAYDVHPYDGQIMLFRALDQPEGSGFKTDPLLGWGPFARGELVVVDVPGTHVGCLQEPHVRSLAVALDRKLAALHESQLANVSSSDNLQSKFTN